MNIVHQLKRKVSFCLALLMVVPLSSFPGSVVAWADEAGSLTGNTAVQTAQSDPPQSTEDAEDVSVNSNVYKEEGALAQPHALNVMSLQAVPSDVIPTVVSTYIAADKTQISSYGEQVQLKVMAKMSSGPDKELKTAAAANSADPQLYSVHYSSSTPGVTIQDNTGILTYDGSNGSVPVDVTAEVKYLDVVYFEGFEDGSLGSFAIEPGATYATTGSVTAKTGAGVPAHSGSYSALRNNANTGNTVRADMGVPINGTVTVWLYNGQPAGNSRNNIYVGTKTNGTGGIDVSNGLLLGEHWDGSTGSGTSLVSRIFSSSFSATSVSRGASPAWHELKWDVVSGTDAKMYIDGVQVASTTKETKYQYVAFAGNWLASNNVTYYDDVKATKAGASTSTTLPIPVQADDVQSLTISGQGGATAITADAGTLQMQVAVTPVSASSAVTWKVENTDGSPTNLASISGTGELKALRNGMVKVTATSISNPDKSNSTVVSISGQTVKVTGIAIRTASGAVNFSTLDPIPLQATIDPSDAGQPAVNWSIIQSGDVANISAAGVVIPSRRGTVQIVAQATDGTQVQSNTLTLTFDIRNTVYVSSTEGSDTNDGLTPATAWKTLDKVNATTFGPGDQILFKAGDVWNGQLRLNGSGSEGSPIIVDRYGSDDPELYPIFNGNGTLTDQVMPLGSIAGQHYAATVEVRNQSYWEINHLEVTNYNATVKNMRAGIIALNEKGTTVAEWTNNQLRHIYIKDCYVHDVNSDPAANKFTGGILVLGNYSDVLVEGNKVVNVAIEGVRNAGMAPSGAPNGGAPTVMDDIRFRNNYVQDVQGDGLVISNVADDGNPNTYNGIVEYNTIVRFANTNVGSLNYAGNWVYGSNDTLFQYNETFGGVYGYNDGEAWDVDLYCKNIVYQYNYSHENRGGFTLVMPGSKYSFYRYNLSLNDGNGDALFDYFPDNNTAGVPWVYNNTFYIGKDITTNVFDMNATSYMKFANNIIVALGKVNNFASGGNVTQGYIKNNIIYPQMNIGSSGGSLEVANNRFVNPLLARPGEIPSSIISAKDNFDASKLDAYKLQANSPAIGAGWNVDIPAGYTDATHDLFGNPLGSTRDIGVHQFTNDAPTSVLNEVMPESITLNQRNVSLLLNEGVFLSATVEPATAWNKVVSWESDNPTVAQVDANGAVKALSLGTATITAKSTANPLLTATARITVKQPITPTGDMKVQADYPYLDASSQDVRLQVANVLSDGSSRELTTTITDANQPRLISVNYSTDNPNVSIDADGVLHVTGDLGNTSEIQVTANVTYEDVVYSEGFESGTTGDLTLESGTDYVVSIQPSTEQAHGGVYSAKRINSVKGSMSKIFPTALNGIASMWIYDDGTTRSNRAVGSAGPVLTDTSKALGLGLFYDGTYGSPTYFATRLQTGATGWTVSTVPRSIGWHELKWDYTDPSMVKMYADGQLAATANVSGLKAVSLVNWWNSSSGNFYYDDVRVAVPKTSAAIPLTVKVNPTQIDGIGIWGAGGANTISVDKGTLQMEGGLLPYDIAGQDYRVNWRVEDETGSATISDTGLLTAVRDGRVKVIVQSVAYPEQTAEMYVAITNQYVPVTGVNVRGTNDKTSIDTAGGSLQLLATVSPSNATNKNVRWVILNTDGSSTNVARVSDTGLLTAVKNGTARVHAITEDGSLDGALDISVTNQPQVVESIAIQSPDQATALYTGKTITLTAVVQPDNAANPAVVWSVVNAGGAAASITPGGVLTTGSTAGEITVAATAQDALGTIGRKMFTISLAPDRVLQAKISEADTVLNAAVIGTAPGQYPQSAADSLTQAIAAAQLVLDNTASTEQQLADAAGVLTAAITVFRGAVIVSTPSDGDDPDRSGSVTEPSTTPTTPNKNEIYAVTEDGKVFPQEKNTDAGTVTFRADDRDQLALTFQLSELQPESTQQADKVLIAMKDFIYELKPDVVEKVTGLDAFLKASGTERDELKMTVKIGRAKLTDSEKQAMSRTVNGDPAAALVSGVYEVHLLLTAPNGQSMDVHAFDNQRTLYIEVDPSFKNKPTAAISISEAASGEQEAGVRTAKYVEMDGKAYMQIRTASHSKYALVQNEVAFRDMTDSHWAKSIVEEAGARLLVNGVQEGVFSPDTQISRAEFITLLVNGLGLPKAAPSTALYTDVRANDWFADEVDAAHKAGLLDWTAGSVLNPNAPITRAEMASTVMAAARYIGGGKLTATSPSILNRFGDADQVAAAAKAAFAWNVEHGIMDGTVDGATGATILDPDATATRAQAAAMLLRMLRTLSLI
ncbi:Ig-like domain-containing protein [Paenibacillus oryzisoli]|uniref:Ig-like domain-containing protein n=1 Tax=Paenibacillus oryzisoli TaxID=1850517 RepID=UPI003D2BD8C1